MKGAHSIKKRRGKGKLAAIVICVILMLVFLGVAIFVVATGKVELPFDLPQFPNSATSQQESERLRESEALESANLGEAPAASTSDSQTYTNALFGYQVDIPEGFTVGAEADNGASIVLDNSSLSMTANVTGYNNTDNLDADAVLASLWNGSEDSIARAEGNRVIIYQHDSEYEYFYWVNIGSGSINQMKIQYPLQDDNRDELDAAQLLMQGFVPGDLSLAH